MTRDAFAFAIRFAVQQTLRKARRSVAAFLGIAGGIVLVLVQLGFQSALYDSAVRLHRNFAGEVVIAPATFQSVISGAWIPKDRMLDALSNPSVSSVTPLYWAQVPVANVDNSTRQNILLLGVIIDYPGINLDAIGADVESLRATGRALFDVKSQPLFGNVTGRLRQAGRSEIEMPLPSNPLQPSATVIGTYAMGGTATIAGTMLTDVSTFTSITQQPPDRINLGIVKLKDGADPVRVARELASTLPPDVKAHTKSDFIALEKNFWKTEAPIGFLFDLGALFGFLISGIYISQVLFQIVDENLPQYALLKSMGYPSEFFIALVGATALLLALAALPVGLVVADVVYRVCVHFTLLEIRSTAARAGVVSAVTIALALMSAMLAGRRLNRADPGSLL